MGSSTCFYYVIFILFGAISAQDCPCDLEQVSTDPPEYSWLCNNRGLTEVPIECFGMQAADVTTLTMTDNAIETIRTIDLFALPDLQFLYLDHNRITFFDPTALLGVNQIKYLHMEYNSHDGSKLEFNTEILVNQPNLSRFICIGCGLIEMPILTDSPLLERVDVRSNSLTTLPRPLFTTIQSESFLLQFNGNENLKDVAADILLPLPNGTIIYFDDGVVIWAANSDQLAEFTDKNFQINVNFEYSIRTCDVDGLPNDITMC